MYKPPPLLHTLSLDQVQCPWVHPGHKPPQSSGHHPDQSSRSCPIPSPSSRGGREASPVLCRQACRERYYQSILVDHHPSVGSSGTPDIHMHMYTAIIFYTGFHLGDGSRNPLPSLEFHFSRMHFCFTDSTRCDLRGPKNFPGGGCLPRPLPYHLAIP